LQTFAVIFCKIPNDMVFRVITATFMRTKTFKCKSRTNPFESVQLKNWSPHFRAADIPSQWPLHHLTWCGKTCDCKLTALRVASSTTIVEHKPPRFIQIRILSLEWQGRFKHMQQTCFFWCLDILVLSCPGDIEISLGARVHPD